MSKLPLVADEADRVSAVIAVVRRLSIARTIQEVMETVTQPARALLRAGGVTFVLREGDLCYYAEEDAISPLWKGKRFPMEACISGLCMEEGRAFAIPDIYQDPRIPHDAYRPTFVRSLAMVPVLQEDPVAAMGAYWPEVREPAREEMELLQTIANAAALALKNIELRNESASRTEHRHELSHRIKNVFSVVQGLANQTKGATVEEFRTALVGRLRALETAHAALFRSQTESTELRALLRDLLLPLVPAEVERFGLSGPTVQLPARVATDFAFIIHELGTNALKHGALSVPGGRVGVAWERTNDRLIVTWQEEGRRPIRPPTALGFGTALIEALMARQAGTITRTYGPDGLRCRLSLPLL